MINYERPRLDQAERHERGYLPHIELDYVAYFVTWRTADSLPRAVYERIVQECLLLPEAEQIKARCNQIDVHLDRCHGACPLTVCRGGKVMKEVLIETAEENYELGPWVIMPNHVHVILKPYADRSLSEVMQLIKGRSSLQINRMLGQTGPLWQRESFDRIIRDSNHFSRIAAYMFNNPVRAGLVKVPQAWELSSTPRPQSGVVCEAKATLGDFDPFEGARLSLEEEPQTLQAKACDPEAG